MEKGLTKNQIINLLLRAPHEGKTDPKKKLTDAEKFGKYLEVGAIAAAAEPEFFAHLIRWNGKKGDIRDTKVALPMIALMNRSAAPEFRENALAHLAVLDPRNLLRAFGWRTQVKGASFNKELKPMVRRYLRAREENWPWWEKTVVQHRNSVKSLYSQFHLKPSAMAEEILFKGLRPPGSIFDAIGRLKDMPLPEAAGTIMTRNIPFLIARGAIGGRAKEPDIVLAFMERMTPTELITNMKWLEKMGVKDNPSLRGALEKALERAGRSKKNVLKTTVAAEAVEDEVLKEKLLGVQEKQIDRKATVDGNWLVLGDASNSMHLCVEAARHVAATLARMVTGDVHLVFFNNSPRYLKATGKTYDELREITKHVTAVGSTSVGCGLKYCTDAGIEIDGIALVSDAQDNTPPLFVPAYVEYSKKFDKQVPVYLYRFHTDMHAPGYDQDVRDQMRGASLDLQEFDLTKGIDYYALPQLVQTMRTQRYSLIDEIMDMRLLTLDDVLPILRKEETISYAQ